MTDLMTVSESTDPPLGLHCPTSKEESDVWSLGRVRSLLSPRGLPTWSALILLEWNGGGVVFENPISSLDLL